ncbi:MAG: hypothetical protein M3536_02880 [Actinomycetota bacterium]|nr:hypothetical protein [Actinomycetota bacterium]
MNGSQPLQGSRPYRKAGAVIVAAGACWGLGISFVGNVHAIRSGPAKTLAAGAAAALLAGAPLFVVALADRASDLEKFAYRRGSNWPFLTYSGLHIGGLAALGAGLLLTPLKPWTGITAAASAPVFGAILAGTKDIPPFVFYLVETAVGVQLMRYEEPEAPAEDDADALPGR